MKDHEGCVRGFYCPNKSWYSNIISEKEIDFGMYADDGSTSGSMTMCWINIGGEEVPKLEVFNDGWNALSLFSDLINVLGEYDEERITQEEFVEILKSCGFKDFTAYDRL